MQLSFLANEAMLWLQIFGINDPNIMGTLWQTSSVSFSIIWCGMHVQFVEKSNLRIAAMLATGLSITAEPVKLMIGHGTRGSASHYPESLLSQWSIPLIYVAFAVLWILRNSVVTVMEVVSCLPGAKLWYGASSELLCARSWLVLHVPHAVSKVGHEWGSRPCSHNYNACYAQQWNECFSNGNGNGNNNNNYYYYYYQLSNHQPTIATTISARSSIGQSIMPSVKMLGKQPERLRH